MSVDKRGWATGDLKTAACMYNDGSSLFLHDKCIDCMHGNVEAFIFLQFLDSVLVCYTMISTVTVSPSVLPLL